MSQPIDPTSISVVTVTPSGGSAIAGTTTLASDQVTITFVSTSSLLGNKVYAVQFAGFKDQVGNVGATFNSTFT